MKLSPHFTLEELTQSETATRHGISNQPGPGEMDNLVRLADELEQVRSLLGDLPVLISSGYRSPGVNRLVGGAANSDHMSGRAADFICPGFGTPLQVCRAISQSPIRFEQLIMEGTWTHFSVPALDAGARRQVLTAHFSSNGRVTYTPGLA
ncbi:D-Ala-D-Ala carboxypeptidase family metallohydrolase [Paraburkholderia adhaesiva]|uniref:D-Ala-D-Ala carboxypeptidase family metallohydrolase n=1 Tax=Paraburkholderia adhaesiva TaxID=2883244 RepID=UPI001F1D9E1B|nr:D-Ala-D-Ala carboxypeptidase family metallohydrolase [Paraburkholderia adhaesiva]